MDDTLLDILSIKERQANRAPAIEKKKSEKQKKINKSAGHRVTKNFWCIVLR